MRALADVKTVADERLAGAAAAAEAGGTRVGKREKKLCLFVHDGCTNGDADLPQRGHGLSDSKQRAVFAACCAIVN